MNRGGPLKRFLSSHQQTFAAAWAATFFFNMAWGVVYPIRNIYIHDLGFSLMLIGSLSTVSAVSMSLSGVVYGWVSDRIGRRGTLVAYSMIAAVFVYFGYLVGESYLFFLVIILLDSWLMGGYSVLVEALVTSILPESERGKIFGRYRISGSIGYAISSALLGTLTVHFSIRAPFVFAGISVAVAAVFSLLLKEQSIPRPAGVRLERVPLRKIWQIMVSSGVIWLFAAEFISIAGSQMAYPFQSIYYKEVLHATTGQIGFFATISVLFEIPAMLYLGALSDRYGRIPIIVIGFLTGTLTWILIYLAGSTTLIFFASALNGIGIIRHSIGIALITDRVDYRERGTLMGLTYVVYGVAGLISPMIGGAIAQWVGTRNLFIIAAVFSAAAGIFFWSQNRKVFGQKGAVALE